MFTKRLGAGTSGNPKIGQNVGFSRLNLDRRGVLAALTMTLLSACAVVPRTSNVPPPPPPKAEPTTTQDVISTDTARHRIALLVPTTGANGGAGQSIANAANMALLDTNASNLRISTYDTAADPRGAAQRALADGNELILGPLLANDIPAVAAVARARNVPLISFSNDEDAAARDVFVMGTLPGQSVTRTVEYAQAKGIRTFAALIPRGEYGNRTSDALLTTVRAHNGAVIAMETFDRTPASITAAARRLKEKSGYDAILIADGGSLFARAAAELKGPGTRPDSPRLLGTELLSGEKELTTSPAVNGTWFSAVSDTRFGQFSQSYRNRFGTAPFRISTMGYDAVLLTLRIARDWKLGAPFPISRLVDSQGFVVLDGALRFSPGGLIERALEVREVQTGAVKVVSPAPGGFTK